MSAGLTDTVFAGSYITSAPDIAKHLPDEELFTLCVWKQKQWDIMHLVCWIVFDLENKR